MLSTILAHLIMELLRSMDHFFCMQDGITPVYMASEDGHTDTVALLLTNKADINAASKVQQFKIFKYIWLIDNELQDFKIAFFILSTILAHISMNYYLTWFMLFLYAGGLCPSAYSFCKRTHWYYGAIAGE
jgi:hypothetical protein